MSLDFSIFRDEEAGQMAMGRFLGGIAALIWSRTTAEYLLLRRSGQKDYAPGAWECVTGRVEQGEGFEDALHREVYEELRLEVRVECILGTTHFHRGTQLPENELIGVVYLCSVPAPVEINFSQEHSEYRWLPADQALSLLGASDAATQWARRVIARAESITPSLLKNPPDTQGKNTFELG